jgi:hypothetical protein
MTEEAKEGDRDNSLLSYLPNSRAYKIVWPWWAVGLCGGV